MIKSAIKSLLGKNTIAKIRRVFPTEVHRDLIRAGQADLLLRSTFYASFVNKGDISFDVGANIGDRTAPLLQLGSKVIAIEPQKVCYKHLKRRFGNKITLVTKGLGETESVQKFYLSNGSVLSSFSKEWIDSVKTNRFKDYNWDKSVDVEMTTADKLIEQYGLPTFIKIDVEGYELEVLKGLNHPISMISFEYTVPQQADKAVQCINRILAINKNMECNYCIADKMEFINQAWLSADDMIKLIHTDEFMQTLWGDIYVRTKPQ